MEHTSRQRLEASKPVRENFPSQEEFEEALGYWMGHVGRILAFGQPHRPPEPEPDPMQPAIDALEALFQRQRMMPPAEDALTRCSGGKE